MRGKCLSCLRVLKRNVLTIRCDGLERDALARCGPQFAEVEQLVQLVALSRDSFGTTNMVGKTLSFVMISFRLKFIDLSIYICC